MILWVVLFALVVAISFVLAAQSMRDFAEIPAMEEEYSLFLIRKLSGLNTALLNSIHQDLSTTTASITSFERLFKGKKSALVVFGPRKLIFQHKDSLDLLELEDYTNVDISRTLAWEVGIKNPYALLRMKQKIFAKMPQFLETEQFWWQMILSSSFKPQLTAVVVSADSNRKHTLTETLYNLAPAVVSKLPKAFSNAQLADFYQKRSFRAEGKNPNLTSEEILQLLLI